MRNVPGSKSFSFSRTMGALLLMALVSACATPQAKKGMPRRGTAAAPPPGLTLKQCYAKLDANQARYTPLPNERFGGGCSMVGAVKLLDIGVPTTGLGPMTCGIASNFTAWVRYGVAPAARIILGSELTRVETFGTYSCRPIAGSNRLSEHGHANAIDVSAFVLADGRRITITNDWNGSDKDREFLRIVRQSACKRFRTVLSPDYNEAHHDHLHFDMGGKGTYCR